MIRRVLLATLVGTLVLMVWGVLFWTIMPFSQDMMKAVATEDEILKVLDLYLPESGVYFMPLVDMYDKATQDIFLQKHKRGPIARISIRKDGADAQSPLLYIEGFVHYFVSVLLSIGIMMVALPRLTTYRSRVFFVFLVGVFAAFFTHLSDVIWWYTPLRYAIYYIDFHVLGWLFVGLAIAAIIKPPLTTATR